MSSLGYRLTEARKKAGFTQSQVADRLFVTTQSVSLWENDNNAPDISKLPELAELYNVTTDWLLSGKLPSVDIIEVTSDLSDRLFDEGRMSTYVNAYCVAKGLYQTKKALAFAKEKHSGQFRKPGHSSERIPYIYHPLLLTCHALALGMDEEDLLSTCLLHDVVEDCGVSPEELPVSDEAKEAVRLLSKDDSKNHLSGYTEMYYESISQNRIATIVKILDRCNNITGMATSFSDEKMAEYIKETKEYVSPLMEKARILYPEYSNQLFLIRYHMNSVLEALRHHMKSSYEVKNC